MTDVVLFNQAQGADALIVSEGAPGGKGDPGSPGEGYPTRTAMAARLAPALLDDVYLTEAGREGKFVVDLASSWTAKIAADTAQGIFVASTADAAKVYRRVFSGAFDVRWFGAPAKGDCTAVGTGTDIAGAINAAVATGLALSKSCSILIPGGALGYRVASTLVFTSGVKLVGEGWHQNPGTVGVTSYSAPQLYRGSLLVFDANVKGMEFFAFTDNAANATAYEYESSTYSIIEDLMLYGGGGTDATAHGIQVHVEIRMRNVRIDNFAGNGLHINADTAGSNTYGQASLSELSKVTTRFHGCHGIYVAGGDANVVWFAGVSSSSNGGCGILDTTTLGNGYSAAHAANNNQSYGASNAQRTKVLADWAGLSDQLAGSIITTSVNAQHVFDDACYVEGGNGGKAEILAPAIILGGVLSGDAAHTTSSNALRFNGGKIKNVDEIRARTTSLVISKGVLDLTDDQAYAGPSVGARLQYSSVTGLGLAGVGSSYDINIRNAAQSSAILISHNSTEVQHPGSLSIGGGTPLTNAVVYTPSITPASVAAATVAEQTFTVTGLTTADKVIVNPPASPAATGIAGARVSAANTLALRFINPTAGALTPTAGTYTVLAFRS